MAVRFLLPLLLLAVGASAESAWDHADGQSWSFPGFTRPGLPHHLYRAKSDLCLTVADNSVSPVEGGASVRSLTQGNCVFNVYQNFEAFPILSPQLRRFVLHVRWRSIRDLLGSSHTLWCMDPKDGASAAKGSAVVLRKCDLASETQDWEQRHKGETRLTSQSVQWRNKATGLCLDVEGGSYQEGANAVLWDCA